MNRSHESDDQLELYALDRLSEAEIKRVECHLMLCESCRDRLEETAAFAFAVREALKTQPETARSKAPSGWLAWLPGSFEIVFKPHFAMAAFAAVILATGVWFLSSRPDAGKLLAPVASLQVTALRGEMQTIPASKVLDLTLADSPSAGGPFRVEMVDANGDVQWTGAPANGPNGLSAHITKAVVPGVYFARLYDASGKLLHEYGFRAVSQ